MQYLKVKSLLFTFSLLPFLVFSQTWQQNNLEYGHQFKGLKTTRALLIPIVQTTSGQGRDTGAIYYKLSDSSIYVYTGSQWRQIAGGAGGSTDTTSLSNRINQKVDSVTFSNDSAFYYVGGTATYIGNIAEAAAGGDTTIFEIVLDSTGQQNTRVLYAKNAKIASDDRFFYDETNNKLVINAPNISVGGPNTKLYVSGNAIVSGNLTGGAIIKQGGTSSQFLKADGSVDANTYITNIPTDSSVSINNRINLKQNALTLTTTGSSGAATLVGSTLNIPQYSGGGGSIPADTSVSINNRIVQVQSNLDTTRTGIRNDLNTKQATLVSGTNIKTVNGVSVLGSGNVAVSGAIWNRAGIALQADVNRFTDDQSSQGEPSVILDTTPAILTGNSRVFKMWYTSGWVSNPKTNYAESADGINWTPYTSNPVLNGVSRSYVLKTDSNYILYSATGAGGGINRYTSSNGISWTLRQSNIISTETFNTNGNYNVAILIDGATWYMMVEGRNAGGIYSLGVYTSPDGVTWTTSGVNPVISGLSQGGAMLQKVNGTYYNWCHTGNSASILPSDLKRYSSPDMLNWTDEGYILVRREVDEGPNTALGQLADPFLLAVDSSVYLYYGASTDGSVTTGNYKIKVAIAPYSFSQLVQTDEGDGGFVGVKASRWENNGKDMYFNAGNIGIGTGSPANAIDVLRSASGTHAIRIKGETATNQILALTMLNSSNSTASFGITGAGTAPYGATSSNQAYMYNTTSMTFMNDVVGTVFKWATGGNTENMRLSTTGLGIGQTSPHTKLHTTSLATAYTGTATGITLDISHSVVNVTATGQTITLPTAVGISGRQYTIKLTASGTGTVATTSSQTIDGSTTYSLSAQYKYVTVVSDGANWIITANN